MQCPERWKRDVLKREDMFSPLAMGRVEPVGMVSPLAMGGLRAIFVLRIFRLRIFESKFGSHHAKKLDVHEENPSPLFKNLFDSNSDFEDC